MHKMESFARCRLHKSLLLLSRKCQLAATPSRQTRVAQYYLIHPTWRASLSTATTTTLSSVEKILRAVQAGRLDIHDAALQIHQAAQHANSDATILHHFAQLDHDRWRRTGFPEAVFAEHKTSQQVATILDDMAANVNERIRRNDDDSGHAAIAANAILATRVSSDMYKELADQTFQHGSITYHETARIVTMRASLAVPVPVVESASSQRRVLVATAGTTDLPVAEEAAVTLEAAGVAVDRLTDVGVAGLHRIVRAVPRLRNSAVGAIIVCAGMDGALPSVVGGLVAVPVIAVPTSIGYGAALGGVAPLLTMLNACAPGVGVVNIDNGFGAAALAYKCVQSNHRTSNGAPS